MQDSWKAVWSIPYISVAFFSSLKQNFIAYRSSKLSSHPDYIFEIHQLWQSGFSRVYSNCCCSCSFQSEIIKISQSSRKICSNNIVNFQVSTTILNACAKNVWKCIECTMCIYIYIYIYIYACQINSILKYQLCTHAHKDVRTIDKSFIWKLHMHLCQEIYIKWVKLHLQSWHPFSSLSKIGRVMFSGWCSRHH